MRLRHWALTATLISAFCSTQTLANPTPVQSPYEPIVGQAGKDVIWVPTPQTLVDRMLDMAQLKPSDYLIDLGSGDGRTVVTAAKRGSRAHGIEYNPDLVTLAQQTAKAEGVADRATFEKADIFASDFSKANVITLFLLPDLNLRLRPTLLNLAPGTRILSNSFLMGDWEPDQSSLVQDNCVSYCYAYLWFVPAQVSGQWQLDGQPLKLEQHFQFFSGTRQSPGSVVPIENGKLTGAQIQFSIGNDRYTGEVQGDRMQGLINGKTTWQATRE